VIISETTTFYEREQGQYRGCGRLGHGGHADVGEGGLVGVDEVADEEADVVEGI